MFLLIGKFVTPFFLLLPRDSKRSDKMLWIVGCFMMIAQWIDVMWMVQPEFFKEGPRFGWIEIGVALGFVGPFHAGGFALPGEEQHRRDRRSEAGGGRFPPSSVTVWVTYFVMLESGKRSRDPRCRADVDDQAEIHPEEEVQPAFALGLL